MTGGTTTVGIEVRADGTQEAARDLAAVDASLKKIQTDLGGTAQPAGVAAQGLEQLGAAGKSAGAGLGAVGASAKKAAEGLGSVSKFASSAKFDKVVSDLGAMGVKLNTSSLHAQKLAKAMQQVERERAFQQLAADANLSTLQLAKFRAELGDTRGALATLSNGLGLSKAAMLAFAAAVAFGGRRALKPRFKPIASRKPTPRSPARRPPHNSSFPISMTSATAWGCNSSPRRNRRKPFLRRARAHRLKRT